jgi:hypothetical protein
VRTSDHVHWEKVLPGGEVLKTYRSLAADKPIGPNVLATILREQLRVNKAEFFGAIDSGRPVDRPVEPLDEKPVEYPDWVVLGLARLGIREEDARQMSMEEATELLQRLRASG